MRLSHIWPLGFLIFIPAIVLLYLLKQKAQEEKVSSLYLWQAVYKNLQATTPWEKLKNNLLMYLQILAMLLLIFALTSPYLTQGGKDYQNVLLVIDESGSMNSIYNKGETELANDTIAGNRDINAKNAKTRLDIAKEQSKDYIDKIPSDVRVSVIAGTNEPSVILSNSTDRTEIRKVIDNIEGTDTQGTLSNAVNLAASMVSSWENYQAVFFTDSSLDIGKIQGEVVNLNTSGNNGCVDYVSHKIEADGSLTILVKISNTGNSDLQADINLYLDNKLELVEEITGEKEDFLKPGESRILYFKNIKTDASVIKAEINETDSLPDDNIAFDVLSGGSTKKVLFVSEQNVFLEKAVHTLPDIELYKTPDISNVDDEVFDLYIFDGVVPETLPKEGNLLFFNPTETVEGLFEVNGTNDGTWITTKDHEVTAYVEDFTFGVNEVLDIDRPDWAESFLSYTKNSSVSNDNTGNRNTGGNQTAGSQSIETAGFIGKTDGRTVGVIAFDIHHSDLPLQAEFPILIYGLANQCMEGSLLSDSVVWAGNKIEIYSQNAEEDITVIRGAKVSHNSEADGTRLNIEGTGTQKDTFKGTTASLQYNETKQTGLYKVKQGDAEAVFAVNFPVEESQTFGTEAVFTGENITQTEGNGAVPNGGMNLRVPLIILILILLLMEWFVTIQQGILPKRDKLRRNLIIGLQGSVLILLLLAIWNPSIEMGSKNTTTIFLVDVSDSVSGQKQEVEEFVKEALKEMPDNNKAGVVAFGADSRVEQFVSEKNLFSGLETLPVTTATNLEKAVQGAMALFPEEEAKRLVLITDGNENEGSLKSVTQSILNSDVQVQVKKLASFTGDEVFVEELQVPDKINIGDTFKVEVIIQSNIKTSAVLSLYAGNTLKGQKQVELETGSNRFIFKDVQKADGLKAYRVIVEPEKDTKSVNNEYAAFTRAETAERVLLIEGKANTASAMEEILTAANINYQVSIPDAAPRTLMEFNQYKSIILLNVHGDDLPEGFMTNVESYVRDYAGGLVAIGGDNSFALGNYRGTSLENVLPVYMDLQGEKEVPKMAIALVIDRSGSMANGNETFNQLELAKESAVAALDTLRETDEIGVVAFESSYEWIVPMTTATDRETLEDAIYSIGLGGGTSIYPAVNEACQKLKESNAKLKHIILLTDGQDGFNQYEDLLKDLENSGITLSTVAVGDGADTRLLEYLAEEGNGRTYYTNIDTDIPRIFAKEIFLSVNSYLINEEFTPIRTSQKDMLEEVVQNGLPSMLGYIASTKKELATMHLMSEREDPILTSWQYGLGKTVAFNSDGENNWTANYAAWSDYPLFWKNIIEYTITDMSSSGSDVVMNQSGSGVDITFTTEEYSEESLVEVIATDEDGNSQKLILNPSQPGVFEGRLDTSNTGVYSISVTQREGEEVISTENTAAAVQYSSEYRIIEDTGLLGEWVRETGGTFIEDSAGIFNQEVKKVNAKRNLAQYFLMLAIIVFMAAIVCKRLDIGRLESVKKGQKLLHEKTKEYKQKQQKHSEQKEKESSGRKRQKKQSSNKKWDVSEVKPSGVNKETGKAKEAAKLQSGNANNKTEKSGNKREMLDTATLLKKKNQR